MSFAVVHVQKFLKKIFKSSSVKGIQFHNQNQINYSQMVKEIIKNNVITDRAIRKDAVVMCNLVVTSNKAFSDVMAESEQEKFFNEVYNFFTSR